VLGDGSVDGTVSSGPRRMFAMHLVHAASPVSRPRWDGHRVTFDINDGKGLIRCAISHAALLDIAGRTHLRPSELMDCFMRSRPRIESIAWAKFGNRSDRETRRVHVWSGDIDPPPATAPMAACIERERLSAIG
jgi:hypothetical protein